MKNSKNQNFFTYYLVVGALIFGLALSCKSNEYPKKVLYKVSDIVETWRSYTSSNTFL